MREVAHIAELEAGTLYEFQAQPRGRHWVSHVIVRSPSVRGEHVCTERDDLVRGVEWPATLAAVVLRRGLTIGATLKSGGTNTLTASTLCIT